MKNALFAVVAAAAILGPAPARATTIEFEAVHLGGSLWQYDYFVTDGLFDAQQGFMVLFDEDLYAGPLTPVFAAPDWDVLVTVPDPVLDSEGTYDALALLDHPSFAGPFSVTFTWLGPVGSDPGSQDFIVYVLDASGFPDPIERAETIPHSTTTPVPEPSTLLLLGTGAITGGLRARRRGRGSILPSR